MTETMLVMTHQFPRTKFQTLFAHAPRRSGWCLSGSGRLLLFTAEALTAELRGDRAVRDAEGTGHPRHRRAELEQSIEQCYYCLYGHPSKRTRAKHLQDHSVTQVSFDVTQVSCDVTQVRNDVT